METSGWGNDLGVCWPTLRLDIDKPDSQQPCAGPMASSIRQLASWPFAHTDRARIAEDRAIVCLDDRPTIPLET
jgi:hypothetical protein